MTSNKPKDITEEEAEEKVKQFHELGLDDRILKV